MWFFKLWLAWRARGRFRSLVVDGRERTYCVHIPRGLDADRPVPVVLALHGATMTGPTMAWFTRLDDASDESGFLVVYPDGTGSSLSFFWNAGACCGAAARDHVDDVGFIRALLDDLAGVYRVDPLRVFAAGVSNGAMMAYRLGAELSDRIAAVACIGGTMAIESCRPTRPVPVLHVHGTNDEFVPFAGGPGRRSVTGADHRSVESTIRAWVQANGCEETPMVVSLPDQASDGTRVRQETYGGGREGSEVVLIVVERGGHTWPGRRINDRVLGKTTMNVSANDLLWKFFERHPMP
jgi:polyhydroxybutyrate depolymerase